ANQPALGAALGKTAAYAATSWTSLNVTRQIRGNGTYSFALVTTSSTMTNIASRESGGNAPQLIVETAAPSVSTPAPPVSIQSVPPPPPVPVQVPSPTLPQTSGDVQPAFPIRAA